MCSYKLLWSMKIPSNLQFWSIISNLKFLLAYILRNTKQIQKITIATAGIEIFNYKDQSDPNADELITDTNHQTKCEGLDGEANSYMENTLTSCQSKILIKIYHTSDYKCQVCQGNQGGGVIAAHNQKLPNWNYHANDLKDRFDSLCWICTN